MVLGVIACTGGTLLAAGGSWKALIKPALLAKAKELVSTKGPDVLAGSKCEVEDVQLTLGPTTTVAVAGLVVHNLEPYKTDSLMKLTELVIEVDLASAAASMGKEVEVKSILVNGVHLTWEKGGVMSSNIEGLLGKLKEKDGDKDDSSMLSRIQNLQLPEVPGSGGQDDAKKEPEPSGAAGGAPKVLVRQIRIDGVELHIVASMVAASKPDAGAKIKVPAIEIKDLAGSSVAKLVHVLVKAVLTQALTSLVDAGHLVTNAIALGVSEAAEQSTSWFGSWFNWG